ncbi:flagellar basal-body rod protein FlgF [Aquipuribacter nitratireducens]|uniref:Flagellar hook protein FlgE n=1 Tax=Aquipuribacter nitratireducens TaxID=650104 RepID=A0ABW0GQK7_9MICO
MLRSMFSSISGLRAHQTMMDVTGNNIANVNTTGFKGSQTIFQDTLSQLLQGAGAPDANSGGTNPAQVGLGTRVAGISTNFSQGAAQTTGRATDLMISGDGFFVVDNGNETLYTRAGSFSFDAQGRLVTPDGAMVQGWGATGGVVDTNGPLGPLTLPIGVLMQPQATSTVTMGGNLPADSAGTTPITTALEVYDAQGNARTVTVQFTKVSATQWTVTATDPLSGTTTGTVTFAADGTNPTPPTMTVGGIALDLSGMTGYAGTSTAAALSQDGYAVGTLTSFGVGPDGGLVGVFSNGRREVLGQLALATFANPNGLEKAGGSMYRPSVNTGAVQVGVPGDGRGTLAGGMLEMSNVDLSQEFTNLIIAQRGFQANSRVITASDEILQDLVNMKR